MMPLQMHRASSLGLAPIAGQRWVLGARCTSTVIAPVTKLLQVKGAVLENALHLLKTLPGLLGLDVEFHPWPGRIDQLLVQLA